MEGPRVYGRDAHNISRKNIPEYVLKVLYRLKKNGYQAYLVGGCVRDLLVGRTPKDFDVVSDARPEDVKRLFRNCRLIGRRFRLAHVYFQDDIVEVATFRGTPQGEDKAAHSDEGMILRDNVYGTIEDDAWRRDFTLNSLYYNIADFSITDYTGGFLDIQNQQLRMIGDPYIRFREDPVRMLRALRFEAILGFSLSKNLTKAIQSEAFRIQDVAPSRLFDEILKLFHSGRGHALYPQLKKTQMMSRLFPLTQAAFAQHPTAEKLLAHLFENTDTRVQNAQWVTPAFLYAGLLWYPMMDRAKQYTDEGLKPLPSVIQASQHILKEQAEHIVIPQRIGQVIRDIWIMQTRLEERNRYKIIKLFSEPRFRAAYDFLLLRAQAGEKVAEIASWWTTFVDTTEDQREEMIRRLPRSRRRRPRKRYQKPTQATGDGA